MRVIQIGGYMSGAQKTIEEAIHQRLIDSGDASVVAYARGHSCLPGTHQYENKAESLITRGLNRVFGNHSCFSFFQTFHLLRIIKRFKPDLVHLHVLHGGTVDYHLLFRYLKKSSLPVVYTMHDMWALTGKCTYYTESRCGKYRDGCIGCPICGTKSMKQKTHLEFERKKKALEQLPELHVVAVSEWVAREMNHSFLAERPITVIYNGVEQTLCDKKDSEYVLPFTIDRNKINLVSVAAFWDSRKGLQRLIELSSMLNDDYNIILVGNITEDDKKRLNSNMISVGYIADRTQLFALYKAADLYISMSFEETFGMTFVESALMGTRSLGYTSTAIGEILSLIDGVAVLDLSVTAFKEAILSTLKHQKNKLSKNEIETIKRKMSVERMSCEYYMIYKQIVDGERECNYV